MRQRYFFCIVLTIILALFLSSAVNAQFGKLKKKVPKKEEKAKPKGPGIDKVLARVKYTKASFQGATQCVSQSRDILFDISATEEMKNQLRAKEVELADAKSEADKERITIEMNKMKDEEIDRAHKSGELEKKQLDEKQLVNSGKLIYNMGLAVVLDKQAIDHGPQIIDDGKLAVENAKADKLGAAKNAGKINELSSAISKDIPAIMEEAPKQVKTLNAFLSAANALKESNKIKDLGVPTADDKFQDIDF